MLQHDTRHDGDTAPSPAVTAHVVKRRTGWSSPQRRQRLKGTCMRTQVFCESCQVAKAEAEDATEAGEQQDRGAT